MTRVLATPHALWLLLLLPALADFFASSFRARDRAMRLFAEPRLMASLARSVSVTRRYIKAACILGAVLFIVAALARPQFGTVLEVVRRQGVDIVFALDTSLSMLAEDIKPNRLMKARSELRALLARLKTDRVGLVTFSGNAFLACPLTTGYAALQIFLDAVKTGMMPRPGTDLAAAVRASLEAFDKNERKFKVLVLITDGEDHGKDLDEALQAAVQAGVRIFSIGIGTTEGEPIPLREAGGEKGFRRAQDGRIVVSHLDPEPLARLAGATGGSFHQATRGELEIARIYEQIQAMEKKEFHSAEITRYADQFQVFLVAANLLLSFETVLSDRRPASGPWEGRFQ